MRRAAIAIAIVSVPRVAIAQAPPPAPYGYGYGAAAPPEVEEPPPPSGRRAPRSSLWTGVRGGYEVPLGDAYQDKATQKTITERQLVGGGPTLEADVGGRFGRGFLPFVFAAHTFATRGNGAGVTSSSTNAFGFGLRYAFTPDAYGFIAELAFAYRLTTARLADGTDVRAGAPGELRIAVGADLRLSASFSISPLVSFAVGSYSDVTAQAPGGRALNVVGNMGSHGYVGLGVGGHFDLFGRP